MNRAFSSVLLTSMLLMLSACGPPRIDAELRPYVEKFEKQSGTRVTSDVGFKKIDSKFVGVCEPDPFRNQVWIDPRAWEKIEGDDAARELVVFHELGHCELGRKHDNRLNEEGDPVSVMYKGPLSSMIVPYVENRGHYLAELFGH